jgi:hypothetical protein
MKRRLLNLLTTLSLLLCAAVALLSVRSRGGGDQFVLTAGGRLWWVVAGPSTLRVITAAGWPGAEHPRRVPRDMKSLNDHSPTVFWSGPLSRTEWRRFGIRVRSGRATTWLDAGGRPAPVASFLAAHGSGGAGRFSAPLQCVKVSVPHWMALTLLGALPLARATAAFTRALRRRRRAARRCCPDCGYDLRATPGKCPECGTMPPCPPVR